ncbi:MAG: FadR family transcriptional regulator [Conexibacter sp.]|nr:FadR family transcriptional regulator [Conexibacter sp.]
MARLHRGPLQTLIAEIALENLPAGALLPRENDLAQRFDISRGTARECIRGLEERGMVVVKHGRGATVREPREWNRLDPDVLAALLSGPQSADILAEFLESRRILEIEAAGLAAERADDADVDQLRDAYRQMVDAAGRADSQPDHEADFHEADVAFHRTLVEITGNRVLVTLVSRIHGAMLQARYPTARPQLRMERTLPEHRRILGTVRIGDARGARRAMAAHLDSVEQFLEEYGRPNEDPRVRPRT